MSCDHSPYTLPTIDLVGGETQKLLFHLYHYTGKRPFDTEGCSCDFSIVSNLNKTGEPIVSKQMESGSGNVLQLKLLPEDTLKLSGKYIYQISIRDADGDMEIPKQGVLYITNNINKSFIG